MTPKELCAAWARWFTTYGREGDKTDLMCLSEALLAAPEWADDAAIPVLARWRIYFMSQTRSEAGALIVAATERLFPGEGK